QGRQFLLANQNLQDLVLKCLLRTKDSRVGGTWQALFDAQQRPPKTTTKTAHCGAVCHIFTHLPPPIHRLVHRKSQPANGWAHVAVLRQRESALVGNSRGFRQRALVDRIWGRQTALSLLLFGLTAAHRVPRFSANLSFLFPDVPFLERFGEAARAGFAAV